MKIIVTSDFHGFLPSIPPCDLLLIAGDIVPRKEHGKKKQKKWLAHYFFPWLSKQPAKKTFFIGGNHDVALEDKSWVDKNSKDYLYLQTATYQGITVWGSPYSLGGMNYAFQADALYIQDLFQKIPGGVDIVLSHGPMRGVLDRGVGTPKTKKIIKASGIHLFVSGHIHNAFGFDLLGDILCLNASLCSSKKVPSHPLWVVEWGDRGVENFYRQYVFVDKSPVPKSLRSGKGD